MKEFLSFAIVFLNSTTLNHTTLSAPNSKQAPVTPVFPIKHSQVSHNPKNSNELVSPLVCSGHGSFTCTCDQGYTGRNCEAEIDFCNEHIPNLNAQMVPVSEICKPYGQCMSTIDGAVCSCQPGFTGQFCQTEVPSQIWTSDRCALYETAKTLAENITVGCRSDQHCIPDNLNCVVVETCESPLGWCLPLVDVEKFALYLNKLLKV